MIVPTSALVALLRAEDDAPRFARALATQGEPKRISAANFLEAAIVIDGSRDPVASRRLDEVAAKADLTIEPVTAEQAHIARAAYRDFGKGSGHRAGLNFGDCFAYALAKALNETLLFKGKDFGFTDIREHPRTRRGRGVDCSGPTGLALTALSGRLSAGGSTALLTAAMAAPADRSAAFPRHAQKGSAHEGGNRRSAGCRSPGRRGS